MSIKKDSIKMLEIGRCKLCNGILRDLGFDTYTCSHCGQESLSDFGSIKKFLEENGASTALQISEGTGISVNRIERYLREGRIEIPEGSEIYIPCLKCNTDIRYGKYCPACAAQLTKQFQSAILQTEIGEIPRKKQGKMRYLDDASERF